MLRTRQTKLRCATALLASGTIAIALAAVPATPATAAPRPKAHQAARATIRPLAALQAPRALDTPAGTAAVGVPMAQTFGGDSYGVNPTSVTSDVNTGDQALEVSHVDLQVAGIGVPFTLKRQYNSRDTAVGAFGQGWSSILDLKVSFAKSGNTATVFGEDGQRVGFTWAPSTKTWTRAAGVRASLTCSGPATKGVAPATCTVTRFTDGVQWTLKKGLVQTYATAGGEGLHFGYSGKQITSVTVDTTATTPLVVHLTRNSSGEVTKVTTPTRTLHYGYTSGMLTSFTDPTGRVWRMAYSAHQLTSVNAYPTASSTTSAFSMVAFYTSGRTTLVTLKDGTNRHQTQFSWKGSGSTGTETRQENRTVDEVMTETPYKDKYSNGVLVGRTDPYGATVSFTWNSDLDLVKSVNELGSKETLGYDSYGDETSQVTQLSASASAKVTHTYDSAHRLTSTTDADGAKTTYTYKNDQLASIASIGTTSFTYATDGQMKTMTDAAGNVTHYSYDAAGNETNSYVVAKNGARPEGNGPLFGYDEAGDKTLSVPASANQGGGKYTAAQATVCTYNGDGLMTKQTQPGGIITTNSYDAAGHLAKTVDPSGNTSTYSYVDRISGSRYIGFEMLTKTPAGTYEDDYDASGDLENAVPPQPKNPQGDGVWAGVTSFNLDDNGNVDAVTDATRMQTTYVRDAAGNVIGSSNGPNVQTSQTRNLVGWVTATTSTTQTYPPDEGTTGTPVVDTKTATTKYDAAGNILAHTSNDGSKSSYTYGPGGRVTKVSTGGAVTTYGYNDAGQVTSEVDPSGTKSSFSYDALGHELKKTVDGHEPMTTTYNVDGQPATTVDADGRTATYGYDALGRKTSVAYSWAKGSSGPSAPKVTYAYNGLGLRTQMTDGTGVHKYSYDKRGRLTAEQTTPKSGAKQNFHYKYSTGQLTETYPDGTQVTDSLDDAGNLLGVSVPAQSDGTPAFTARLAMPTGGAAQGSQPLLYQSATPGGLPQLAATAATTTGYSDGLLSYTFNTTQPLPSGDPGYLSAVGFYNGGQGSDGSSPEPPEATYTSTSDKYGNLVDDKWDTIPLAGTGAKDVVDTDYGYNGGLLGTTVSNSSGGPNVLTGYSELENTDGLDAQSTYQYDQGGRLSSMEFTRRTSNLPVTGGNWDLDYGNADEISQITGSAGTSLGGGAAAFSYDKAGNTTDAGNLVGPQQPLDGIGTGWTFRYNAAGQLAEAVQPLAYPGEPAFDQLVVKFSYDGDGNLVKEADYAGKNATTPTDVYSLTDDPRTSVPQLVEADISTADGSTHQRYIWGNGPLALEQNGTYLTLHDSQQGTPTELTDPNGQLDERLDYDPYGNVTTAPTSASADYPSPVLIGFDASFADPIVGIDDMDGRWYDPDLGIWMTRADTGVTPGAAGSSAYEFAGDNPTNLSQPTGTTNVSAAHVIRFSESSNGTLSQYLDKAWAVFDEVDQYSLIKDTISNSKDYLDKLEEEDPAASAAEGAEVSEVGLQAEAQTLESEAGAEEGIASELTELVAEGESPELPEVGFVIGVATGIFMTEQTCSEYGSSSEECISSAVTLSISTAAFLVCNALTEGAGSVLCGELQSVLQFVIPYVISNAGAFLDAATFGSTYNVQDGVIFAGELFLAVVFPYADVLLLGLVIYANWGPLSSDLEEAGEALASGFSWLGTGTLSGIDTLGSYLASGLGSLVGELHVDQWAQWLLNGFDSLANAALDVVDNIIDSVGNALCDFVSELECIF